MKTTPSKTTTPADDPEKSTDAAAVTEDLPTDGAPETEASDEAGTSKEAGASSEAEASKEAETFTQAEASNEVGAEADDLEPDPFTEARHGVGAGAAAVVSAALGVVALTGAWSGRVAAERETLMGQIQTAGGSSAAEQISAIYGDAWHTTALVNGVFAVLALLVGIFVLVRPAFGAPSDRPQPAWVRAVALAGIALGVLGVLISAGMYFDLFVSLPSAGAPAGG
ncbi:hypothetical protein RI138_24675 [Streptomyces sp. C11-1]|uniref:Integral membrane protein n=1 Tax=Streptomyces durocortorensis TaxID=2811104 RepID=A0ABY9W0V1_9ACTN|nr:hypothetical protein [Streptomyces durocortorensis]WNF29769.1 hypothetical protein RI138_24675 [Streptomyces durocortorensis]